MDTAMNYERAKQWILAEDRFTPESLGKCESVMCLGNGYMGLRSALEEEYVNEKRDLFIAGTFNKFDESEVTELPNAADVTSMELHLKSERFSLESGRIESYERFLNLKTGELVRNVIWISPRGKRVRLTFKRIVSMKRMHVIAQQVSITPLNRDMKIRLRTGIDGQVTNSGAQHFSEVEKRFYDHK